MTPDTCSGRKPTQTVSSSIPGGDQIRSTWFSTGHPAQRSWYIEVWTRILVDLLSGATKRSAGRQCRNYGRTCPWKPEDPRHLPSAVLDAIRDRSQFLDERPGRKFQEAGSNASQRRGSRTVFHDRCTRANYNQEALGPWSIQPDVTLAANNNQH